MSVFSGGTFKAGFNSLRSAKMRNFWTMLGVIIGVASVISIVSIGEGVKQQISGQIHKLGKDIITVRPEEIRTSSKTVDNANIFAGSNITGVLTNKDVLVVSNTKGVSATAPLAVVTGSIKGENGSYNDGFVLGTSSDLPSLINQSVAYGVFLIDEDAGTNVAVLGSHAAQELFNEEVPLGRTFMFHGQEFLVRGIFNDFNTTPFGQQANFNNAIFIPNDVALSLTKGAAPIYQILAKPTEPSQSAQVASAIERNLDRAHGGQSNLAVLQGSQNVQSSDYILNLLTRLIAGVAAISLLVGGIGIMNVMLVSVAERMHEIGIRKAVGATNRQILNQFMVEATALSLTGGLIGILVAYIIDLGLRLSTNLTPVISWKLVVLATTVSLIVGITFGTVPALKAARRDPIDALRAE